MEFDITIWGALIAGLISFISPCVLPIVPPYLCYLAGVSLNQLTGEDGEGADPVKVFTAALTFVLGFSTVFVALGAGASLAGISLAEHASWLIYVAGAIIIAMGLHFLGVFRIRALYSEARVHVDKKPAGAFGSYLIGLAFGFAWTPCIGPILGTILVVASAEETVSQGALLLAVYSLGIGIPFLLAAAFAGPFMRFMAGFRRHLGKVEKVMGGLLVFTGIMIMTGQLARLSYWMLELFPGLATIG
ncbi:cytochrome c biogenesis CcdA family protein [Coralliovum pocilloporae]|uniref:cytochrome c biogenesis CcdA family protein n=1 Tax=Coralliovum pocilloporae TaxID=3066369 RepID=UPI003307A723